RIDAVIVHFRLVISVGRHQQRLARPFRVRIFPIHLVEFLGRRFVILLGVQEKEALIVERVGGAFGNVVVVLIEQAAATQKRQSQRNANQRRREPRGPRTHSVQGSGRSS